MIGQIEDEGMSETGANYSIRDEIREFWSARAATFDESVGHEIFSEAERRGWHRLITKHLGAGIRICTPTSSSPMPDTKSHSTNRNT